jgi:sialate O-acetylesterase
MPPAILTAPPLLVALVLFAASGCRALCGTPTNVEEPAAETGDEWLLRELAPPEIPDRLRHDLTLHGLFTDGMVLQRDTTVPIWGWGSEGAEIAVSFGETRVATKVSGGRWSVTLPAMPASSDGRELTVTSGSRSIVLKDVLVGDVWLCSGQSNMAIEMKIDRAHPPRAADLDAAGNPLVRFYKVDRASSRRPRVDVPPVRDDIYEPWSNAFLDNQWRHCTKEWAQHISATAYYFARDLQPRIDCPLGILVSARGGSAISSWVSADVIKSQACWGDARQKLTAAELNWPSFALPLVDRWRAFTRQYPTKHRLWLAQQKQSPGQSPVRIPPQPTWPSCFYNGMIHPLAPFAVKGVLWYQGETDVGNAAIYADKLVSLIQSWRHLWKRPEMPFIIAQLAPFDHPMPEGRSAELRAAQARVPLMISAAYTASLIDAGMRKNIHPLQKDVAGRRLALVARKEIYGEPVAAYGPALRTVEKTGGEVALSFNHSDSGLLAKEVELDGTTLPGGILRGFFLRGIDEEWIEASARIEGDRVIVASPEVSEPVAVRYAWADFPLANLYNGDDLPASPFQRQLVEETAR